MTNESIFYLLGLALGFWLGYATKSLFARKQCIKVVLNASKGESVTIAPLQKDETEN